MALNTGYPPEAKTQSLGGSEVAVARRENINDLIRERAKYLRRQAQKLEELADHLFPIGQPQHDDALREVIMQGLYRF